MALDREEREKEGQSGEGSHDMSLLNSLADVNRSTGASVSRWSLSSPASPLFPRNLAGMSQNTERVGLRAAHPRGVMSSPASPETFNLLSGVLEAQNVLSGRSAVDFQTLRTSHQRNQSTNDAAHEAPAFVQGATSSLGDLVSGELDHQDMQVLDSAIQWGQQHGSDFVAQGNGDLGDRLPDQSYGGPEHNFPPTDSAGQDAQMPINITGQHTENWMDGRSSEIQSTSESVPYEFALPSGLLRDAPHGQNQNFGGELVQQPRFFSEQAPEQQQYWSQQQGHRYQATQIQYPQNPLRTTGQVFSPVSGQFRDQGQTVTRQAQRSFPEAPAQSTSYRQRERHGPSNFPAEYPQGHLRSTSSQLARLQTNPQLGPADSFRSGHSQPAQIQRHGYAEAEATRFREQLQLASSNDVLRELRTGPSPTTVPGKLSSSKDIRLRHKSWHGITQQKFSAQQPVRVPVDRTYPKSHEREQYYVRRMISAMNHMENAKDNKGMIATWQRAKCDVNGVEDAAWEVLGLCLVAHASEGRMPPKYATFAEHIEAMCHELREQKTMCKRLLSTPYVSNFVNDPTQAARRVENNRRVNGGKKVMIERGREANLATQTRRESEGSPWGSSEQFRETRSDPSPEEQFGEEDLTIELGQQEADAAYALSLNEELNRRASARRPRTASTPARSGASATPAPPSLRITPPESSEGARPSKKRKQADAEYQTPSRASKRPTKTTRSAKYPLVRRPDGTMTIMTVNSPPKPISQPPPTATGLSMSTSEGPGSGLLTLPTPVSMGLGQYQTSATSPMGLQAPMAFSQGSTSNFGRRNQFIAPQSNQGYSPRGTGTQMANYTQTPFNEQPSRQRAPYNMQPSLTPTPIDPRLDTGGTNDSMAEFIDPSFWTSQSHDQAQHQNPSGYQASPGNQGVQENEEGQLPQTQPQQGGQRRQPPRYGW